MPVADPLSYLVWHTPILYQPEDETFSGASELSQLWEKLQMDGFVQPWKGASSVGGTDFPSSHQIGAAQDYTVLAFAAKPIAHGTDIEYAYLYREHDIIGAVGYFCAKEADAFAALEARLAQTGFEAVPGLHKFLTEARITDTTTLPLERTGDVYKAGKPLETGDGLRVWRVRGTTQKPIRFLIHVPSAPEKQEEFQEAVIGPVNLAPFVGYQIQTAKIRHKESDFRRANEKLRQYVARVAERRNVIDRMLTGKPQGTVEQVSEALRVFAEIGAENGLLRLRSDLEDMRVTVGVAARNQARARFDTAPGDASGFYDSDKDRVAQFEQAISTEIAYLTLEIERTKLTLATINTKLAVLQRTQETERQAQTEKLAAEQQEQEKIRQAQAERNAHRTLIQSSFLSGLVLALTVFSATDKYPYLAIRVGLVLLAGTFGFWLPVHVLENKSELYQKAHQWAVAAVVGSAAMLIYAWWKTGQSHPFVLPSLMVEWGIGLSIAFTAWWREEQRQNGVVAKQNAASAEKERTTTEQERQLNRVRVAAPESIVTERKVTPTAPTEEPENQALRLGG